MKRYLCLLEGVGGTAYLGNICIVRALSVKEAKARAKDIFRLFSDEGISILSLDNLKDDWVFFYT